MGGRSNKIPKKIPFKHPNYYKIDLLVGIFLSVTLSNGCATYMMISMVTVSKKEKLLSLHRYYIWANKMRDHFDLTLMTSVTKDGSNGMDAFM